MCASNFCCALLTLKMMSIRENHIMKQIDVDNVSRKNPLKIINIII